MKVYLSSLPSFSPNDLVESELDVRKIIESDDGGSRGDHDDEGDDDSIGRTTVHEGNTVLLWKEKIREPSISKSILLTTTETPQQYAVRWLDQQDHTLLNDDGGFFSTFQSAAGHGIESTSILLTLYQKFSEKIEEIWHWSQDDKKKTVKQEKQQLMEENHKKRLAERSVVHLSQTSPIWKSIQSNSTVHIHVVVVRQQYYLDPPKSAEEGMMALRQAQRSQSLLVGGVSLIKHDAPSHIQKPGRVLYHDLIWLFEKYIVRKSEGDVGSPPWDMRTAKPEFHRMYEMAKQMKLTHAGYPYWKPEVSIKYVIDGETYPISMIHASGMEVTRVSKTNQLHKSGFAHLPALHVDEIGLTSEKYIPVNETITSLPLRISFDRSDVIPESQEHDPSAASRQKRKKKTMKATATSGGISPARWRLLTHLSRSFESQKEMGFEQADIDDLRRMIADTNITLLGITVLASALHLLFEFLTFKNEVSFWKENDDLTGLSVRSLFLDMGGQFIIVLYLIEMDSSLLMIVPSAIGVVIALWKCQRAAGFKFVRVLTKSSTGNDGWHNASKRSLLNSIPRAFGYELRATRLEAASGDYSSSSASPSLSSASSSKKIDLQAMTIEADRQATVLLGSLLLPLVIGYTTYSLIMEEHSSWYSWLIRSASSAVYAFGFVLMTPQLFLNYKLKSVAHLPWKVLIYKSLNTVSVGCRKNDLSRMDLCRLPSHERYFLPSLNFLFSSMIQFIDDLFSFIIKMPTMARISCFRDDVVFFIYLYQRFLYPVDNSRPTEGGGEATLADESLIANKTAVAESKKKQ